MRVDHSAAQLRLAGTVTEARCVDRLAGDEWRAIVGPGAKRRRRASKPDRQRIGRLSRGEDQPVFAADLGHLGCPVIGDVASLGGPAAFAPLTEDQALELPMVEVGGMEN